MSGLSAWRKRASYLEKSTQEVFSPEEKKGHKKAGTNPGLFEKMVERAALGLGSGLFLHVRSGLADTITKVIQLGATNFALLDDFDLRQLRGMNLEYTLDTFSVGDLANGEGFVEARPAASEDDSLENLDSFLTTLDNARVNVDGISLRKLGNFVFHLLALDFINHVHNTK